MGVKRRDHVTIPLAAKPDTRRKAASQGRLPGSQPCVRLREIEMVLN